MFKKKFSKKKTSKKTAFGKNRVYIKDWLYFKPYKIGSSYDSHYLKIANKVLDILESERGWIMLGQDFDLKELACILTSYFEDFINEIGIWRVFTERNEELYGYALPFYDLSEEYDTDYLNPEDCSYIIWHFLSCHQIYYIDPLHRKILRMGKEVYDLIESEIDNAPITNTYEKYFDIGKDVHFFELKEKLSWFGLNSYLLSMDKGRQFAIDLVDTFEKMKDKISDPGAIAYMLQNDYIYSRSSTFSGLPPQEWFSKINGIDAAVVEDIKNVKAGIAAKYIYEGKTPDGFYLLRYNMLDKVFEVNPESIDIPKDIQDGDVILTNVAKWQGGYWVSGFLSKIGTKEEMSRELEKDKKDFGSISFNAYPDDVQEELRESTNNMYNAFVAALGKDVVICENNAALQEALKKQRVYYTEHYTKLSKEEIEEAKKQNENVFRDKNVAGNFGTEKPVALIFVKGIGMLFDENLVDNIELLESEEELNDDDSIDLFEVLVRHNEPSVVRYLLANYPTKNIQYPVDNSPINVLRELEFLMRFYNPSLFGKRNPNQRSFSKDML